MNVNRLGASVGLHSDERELVLAYIATLETGSTRDHCKCQWTEVAPKRWIKGDQHEDCPIHTKEGFLLGFLVFTSMVADGSVICKHGITFDGQTACGICVMAWAKCDYRQYHKQPAVLCARCNWRPELAAMVDAAARHGQ